MILGNKILISSQYDSDAMAFIIATNISNITQCNAISTLVGSLKAAGIWQKMKAIYPFIGGTAASHKFNLKDPRDLDIAYRILFSGGIQHSENGVLPNGSTGFGDTRLNTSVLSATNNSLAYYSKSNTTGNTVDIGVYDGSRFFTVGLSNYPYNYLCGAVDNVINFNTVTKGLFLQSRLSSFNFAGYKNATLIGSNSSVGNGFPIGNALLFKRADGFYGNKECAFASIGEGLTATEVTLYYNIIQTYQQSLNRQV